MRVKEQIHAAWKFCLSFGKRDWELNDYPVSVRVQEIDPEYIGTRLKQHRYSAQVVNWGTLTGMGDTRRDAIEMLKEHLALAKADRAKAGQRLPRPGTRVPIQFASQETVGAYPELAEDFTRRVLNLDWAWISDESSLWDFHHHETNEALIAKIKEVYGVDVSDIQSAKLSEIFERIATTEKAV